MISVIVPVYNAEQSLCRCIDSILAQSYADFELLLVDDGSLDNSGLICDGYTAKDRRVRVFHKANGGVSSARNMGLDNARGEHITFCDADDYVDTEWLAVYGDAITREVDFAIQGIYHIKNNGELETKKLNPYIGTTIDDKRNLIVQLISMGVYGYPVTKLFRRQIIEDYHIRFDEKSAFREDEQFFSKYLEYVTTFRCLDKESYYYILPSSDRAYYTSHSIGYTSCQTLLSLNKIFNLAIPDWILKKEYVFIKDYLADRIVNGNQLSESEIDLYKLIVTRLGYTHDLKYRLLNYFICKSRQKPSFSKLFIKAIRCKGRILNIRRISS